MVPLIGLFDFLSILPNVVNGIFGLGGSAVSAGASREMADATLQATREANQTNIKLQDMANQSNMDLAKYAWQNEVDMWNRQNEYNTPAHQRALLEAAGFNPYLAMGADARAGDGPSFASHPMQAATVLPEVNSGSSAAAQEYGSYLKNVFRDAVETEIQKKQLQMMDLNAEYRAEQIKKTAADTVLQIEKQTSQRQNNEFFRDTLDFKKALIQDSAKIMNINANYLDTIKGDDMLDFWRDNQMTEFEIKKAINNVTKVTYDMKYAEYRQMGQYFSQRLKNMAKQYDLMDATQKLTLAKLVEQDFSNKYLQENNMYPGTESLGSFGGLLVGWLKKLEAFIFKENPPAGTRWVNGELQYYDSEGNDITDQVLDKLAEGAEQMFYNSFKNKHSK